MREPAEIKALQGLKTRQKESQNRSGSSLEQKIVALVKALARAAAERDVLAERERENGPLQ